MTTTYRCIGKGVTDENGVAHMTHSTSDGGSTWTDISSNPGYTGTGKGLVDLCASPDDPSTIDESSVQSGNYTVIDATLIDPTSATTRADIWTNNNNPTITVEDGVVTLTESSGTVQSIFKTANAFSKTDICIEFDFYQVDGSTTENVFWVIKNNNWDTVCACKLSDLNLASQQWHHIKIEFKGTKAKFNNIEKNYDSGVSDNIRFGFLTNGDITSIKYKNFCLYPI